jgi:lysophospholipase L1-like esterase
MIMDTRWWILTGLLIVLLAVTTFVAIELAIIKFNGQVVPAPKISRSQQTFGNGPVLTYVVMGDSTSIGQGTDYEHSYAWLSGQHLAKTHQVRMTNLGVSGARTKDVANDQLERAVELKPDVVLLAVGANDATHFTKGQSLAHSLEQIILGLQRANPNVRIVVTGCPDMSAIPRFPWPARQLAGLRTQQINTVYAKLVDKYHLTFAPIAAKTGPAFRADPTLFASDKFHPDTRGYALWTPIINEALDRVTARTSKDERKI